MKFLSIDFFTSIAFLAFVTLGVALLLSIKHAQRKNNLRREVFLWKKIRVLLDDTREFKGDYLRATLCVNGVALDFEELASISHRGKYSEIHFRHGGSITHLSSSLEGVLSLVVSGVSESVSLQFSEVRSLARGRMAFGARKAFKYGKPTTLVRAQLAAVPW